MRAIFTYILLECLCFSSAGCKKRDTDSAIQADSRKIRANTIAVAWIPNEKDTFNDDAPSWIRKTFVGKGSLFRVGAENYWEMSYDRSHTKEFSNPFRFLTLLQTAFDKLENVENPTLELVINAHGNSGSICLDKDTGKSFDHSMLAVALFEGMYKYSLVGKSVSVNLYYNACNGSSLIREFQAIYREHYSKKMPKPFLSVLVASRDRHVSWSNVFWELVAAVGIAIRNSDPSSFGLTRRGFSAVVNYSCGSNNADCANTPVSWIASEGESIIDGRAKTSLSDDLFFASHTNSFQLSYTIVNRIVSRIESGTAEKSGSISDATSIEVAEKSEFLNAARGLHRHSKYEGHVSRVMFLKFVKALNRAGRLSTEEVEQAGLLTAAEIEMVRSVEKE